MGSKGLGGEENGKDEREAKNKKPNEKWQRSIEVKGRQGLDEARKAKKRRP